MKVTQLRPWLGFCVTRGLCSYYPFLWAHPWCPPAMTCAWLDTLHGRLGGCGPRVTSRLLFHPSGASKVTASGSHPSRPTVRMEAGAPGPTSGHVHGHVGAGCDPVAETVTIPCKYAWLGWAGQGTPIFRPEGLGGEGNEGQGTRERDPCRWLCILIDEDSKLWGEG